MISEEEMQLFSKAFGNRVKSLRIAQGLTQLDLAVKIDVTDRLIQRIEAGEGFTSIKNVYRIAFALDISISKLFEFDYLKLSE